MSKKRQFGAFFMPTINLAYNLNVNLTLINCKLNVLCRILQLIMNTLSKTYQITKLYFCCVRIHFWNRLKKYAKKYRLSYYGLLSL